MPFVHLPPLFRSHAAIAALGVTLAALALPCAAHAGGNGDARSMDEPALVFAGASAEPMPFVAIADGTALDDSVLARQRGTGLGVTTVAASVQISSGANSVTLWDEIAPPSPVPVPADTAHVAQGNTVSYFRK